MQKIRVKYHSEEDGQQLFKTIGRQPGQCSYYARNTELIWYTVSDPLGYAEQNRLVEEDTVFVICDSKGKELFESSNGDDESLFPFTEEYCRQEWKQYCDNSSAPISVKTHNLHMESPYDNLDDWLLSFKDPLMYGEAANMYDVNWITGSNKEVRNAKLSSFAYCGMKMIILKVTMRHNVCGAEWNDYYAGNVYCGAEFDTTSVGTMYSPYVALKKVENMLREEYKDRHHVVYTYEIDGTRHSFVWKYSDAANHLLNYNYRKGFVDEIIEKERSNHTFLNDIEELYNLYGQDILRNIKY